MRVVQWLKSNPLLPTRRLMLILIFVAPFIAASGAFPALWVLISILLIGILILIVTDVRTSSHASDFELVRLNDEKLSIGINNRVEIVVRNHAHRAVNIQVRDEPPGSIERSR